MTERDCNTCLHHHQEHLAPHCGDCLRSTNDLPMWQPKEEPMEAYPVTQDGPCTGCRFEDRLAKDDPCHDCGFNNQYFWQPKEEPMKVEEKRCENCEHINVPLTGFPCSPCWMSGSLKHWTPKVVPVVPHIMGVDPALAVPEKDAINPDHYKAGGIEAIDYLRAKLTPEEFRGYCRGNAMKYLSRLGMKDYSKQEAKKAAWYVDQLIQSLP